MEDAKPKRDPQRKLNPIMQEAVWAEILKLLDNEIIYPISDSQWVSLVNAVPKKAGFIVVENDKKELVQTRLSTKIRVCIDYQKLNATTCKDHFPLLFIDQMLERLPDMNIIVSWMDIHDTIKFLLLPRIKTRLLSPVPLEHLHTEECPSTYAMLPQCSNVACLVSSLTWWKDF